MDLIVVIPELVHMIMLLVTKPFVLSISACLFCLRTGFMAVYMFADMVNTAIYFHACVFWRAVIGAISLILLPVRFFTAIPRERLLEQCLHETQLELDTLVLHKRELEEKLQEAIKEFSAMESELTELEDEHDKAISKVKKLEVELKDLKEENLRLKEIHGKGYWSSRGHTDKDSVQSTACAASYGISYGIPSWKFQDLAMKRDPSDEKKKSSFDSEIPGVPTRSPRYGFTENFIPECLDIAKVLGDRKEIALSQSIFSAVLSLLVGLIVWESREPCMPLVCALFTVVGISLKSVIQFFSTIKNKPASDAVALLSLNWFILGTITYPTLPRIAPVALKIMHAAVHWLGYWTNHMKCPRCCRRVLYGAVNSAFCSWILPWTTGMAFPLEKDSNGLMLWLWPHEVRRWNGAPIAIGFKVILFS